MNDLDELKKAIKAKCLECCAGSWKEVARCDGYERCPLYRFRDIREPGTRKERSRQITIEELIKKDE